MHRFILAAIGALLIGAPPALAAQETTTKLTFHSQATIVDNFSTVFGGPAGSPSAPAFTIYGGPDIAPGTSVFGSVSTPDYYTDAYFFMGVTGEAAASGGSRHLVLGLNQSLAGQSFANLFPSYSEQALIDAVVGLNAGTVPDFGDAYRLVSGFQADYSEKYAFNLKDQGYLTAFSTGQDFGTITTSQTTVTLPDAVPEPAIWMMMIGGVGAIGVMVRRQSRPGQHPRPAIG